MGRFIEQQAEVGGALVGLSCFDQRKTEEAESCVAFVIYEGYR